MADLLLDANFLVLPFQQTVDIFAEFDRLLGTYDLFTLNRTYNEALALEDGRYRQQVERLVEEHGITVVSTSGEGTVDDVLVSMADTYIVCTTDSELRGRLRENDRPHIYLRQEDHLDGENLGTGGPF